MGLRYLYRYVLILLCIFAFLPVTSLQAQSTSTCTVVLSDITLAYDEQRNLYDGIVTIGNDYWCVATMALRVEGVNGLKLLEQTYRIDGRDKLEFNFEGTALKAEGKYLITAIPRDSEERIFVNDDEPAQAQKEFTHRVQQVAPLAVQVLAVNVDHTAGQLLIDLEVANPEEASSYTGYILDTESGASIYAIDEALYRGPRIEIALLETSIIRTAQEVREYRLNFCLKSKAGKQICAEPYAFKPPPPPQLAWWQKAGRSLSDPRVYAPLLIGLISAISWVLIRNARASRSEPILRRPPIGGDLTISTSGGQTSTLVLQVINSPGINHQKRQKILRFPYRIGRDGCDLNFPKDSHISKLHLEIDYRGDGFYITDLGSSNHTYVNERALPPKKPKRIQGVTLVRLGPSTEIELDPAG